MVSEYARALVRWANEVDSPTAFYECLNRMRFELEMHKIVGHLSQYDEKAFKFCVEEMAENWRRKRPLGCSTI